MVYVCQKLNINLFFTFGKSRKYKPGTPAYIIGNGVGEDWQGPSSGIIRSVRFVDPFGQNVYEAVITDINSPSGDSGGPIIVIEDDVPLVIGMLLFSVTSDSGGFFTGGSSQHFFHNTIKAFTEDCEKHCDHKLCQHVAETTLNGLTFLIYRKGFIGAFWALYSAFDALFTDTPVNIEGIDAIPIPDFPLINLVRQDTFNILVRFNCKTLGQLEHQNHPNLILWKLVAGDPLKIDYRTDLDGFKCHCGSINVAEYPPGLDTPNFLNILVELLDNKKKGRITSDKQKRKLI
jgi:hypothetical protein